MEKLKYSLFDLFVYSVPGSLLLFSSCVVYFSTKDTFPDKAIQYVLTDLDLFKAGLFIVISYCCGFISSIIGGYLLWAKERFIPTFKTGEEPLKKSKKFVFVRENSKENFRYIEQWNVLKNFAATFSFVILALAFLFFFSFMWFKFYHLVIGILLSFMLLVQASKYRKWAIIDLDNSYKLYTDGKD